VWLRSSGLKSSLYLSILWVLKLNVNIWAICLLCVVHAFFPVTPQVDTSHPRSCSCPSSPSDLLNLHHLPSSRRSALEGSLPPNYATFPAHLQAPLSKGTKLQLQVIKAIINQSSLFWLQSACQGCTAGPRLSVR